MNDFIDFQFNFLDDAANVFAASDDKDVIAGFGGNDVLVGLGASDYVNGNQGEDAVFGNTGTDTLRGGADDDTLRGGADDDEVFGDLGDDFISGDRGSDTLRGGAGSDRFFLASGYGGSDETTADAILDFTDGEDRFQLESRLSFDRLDIATASNPSDTAIRDTATGEVLAVLKNIASSAIDPSDFIDVTAATINFSAADFNITEDDGSATITVQLSQSSSSPVSVDYSTTTASNATANLDYTEVSGTITFAPGETQQTFEIPITNDTDAEGDETVRLEITNAIGGSLGTPTEATLTIFDDDGTNPVSSVGDTVNFGGVDVTDEAAVAALNGPSVTVGDTTLYIGYEQVSSNNRDPRLVSFTNGVQNWYRTDYEVTGDDGTGVGLLWDGGNNLYGVFTATGTQGSPSEDFREFATDGWLTSYGQGGGAKVSIVAKIDPATGDVSDATFVSALLSNGNSNTLNVTGLSFNGSNVVVEAQSFFSPRRTDTTAMENTGSDTSSPFDYEIEFTPDLTSAVRAVAPGFGS
ncbi:Calx-beta domain-containing protein [Baaleninema sp.]|uniref:Calx-beta domain-containing protein n=1 Tax=Baaleninema sp. TaxID=3101197 RepID=UPI003CFE3DE6